jgi:DNA mismatch repair protein MutL
MSETENKTEIHVLDDATINKIAAGEVVERPASVAKELVENSIDAGARKIEVEIMAGGTSFLRVTDDGKGMDRENAKLSILRHATSKIREVSDLLSIGTLGFRGEALASIAAVSRFHMKTRQHGEDLGTEVIVTGGKLEDVRPAGASVGTTIRVEDLFFNTPARKKFLKTNHTEAAHISDFLMKLSLSHPEIAFRFINNNKLAMITPGNGSLKETIKAVYGNQVGESLLPLALENPAEELKISGYITKPSMLKSSRGWQTFLVNGRLIGSRVIAKAIDNAYRSMVPKSGYPMVVLCLEVPKKTVDVNVHPQKAELKFEDESLIFRSVYKAVLDAVRPEGRALGLSEVAAVVEKPKAHFGQVGMEPMHFEPATAPAQVPSMPFGASSAQPMPPRGSMLRGTGAVSFAEARQEFAREKEVSLPQEQKLEHEQGTPQVQESAAAFREQDSEEAEALEENIVPIGQVDKTYIIAQNAKGLYIIDQHAAHERILFDKLSGYADQIPSQQLLVHQILSFDERETDLITQHLPLFRRLGFSMEPCGPREFRLMEVPADVPNGEAEDMLREILGSLQEMHAPGAAELRKAVLATTACHSAVRAGDELNLRQMQMILEALSHTAYPFTCPHGRPTILKFSSEDLAKMFKRTGFDLCKN